MPRARAPPRHARPGSWLRHGAAAVASAAYWMAPEASTSGRRPAAASSGGAPLPGTTRPRPSTTAGAGHRTPRPRCPPAATRREQVVATQARRAPGVRHAAAGSQAGAPSQSSSRLLPGRSGAAGLMAGSVSSQSTSATRSPSDSVVTSSRSPRGRIAVGSPPDPRMRSGVDRPWETAVSCAAARHGSQAVRLDRRAGGQEHGHLERPDTDACQSPPGGQRAR